MLCFFFNDTATTEIYTLSLHDALPIAALSLASRLALLALHCARPLALQRLDVARPGLHQQVLQGTPVVDSAAHLADKAFGNIHREPPSVVPAVQNMARMLLAGQTGRAVRVSTPTAAKAQRAEHRPPQAGRLVLDPTNDIRGRFSHYANHLLYLLPHTSQWPAKP